MSQTHIFEDFIYHRHRPAVYFARFLVFVCIAASQSNVDNVLLCKHRLEILTGDVGAAQQLYKAGPF